MSRVMPESDPNMRRETNPQRGLTRSGLARWAAYGLILSIGLTPLAVACSSSVNTQPKPTMVAKAAEVKPVEPAAPPDPARRPRLATVYTDESFLRLSREGARQRLEQLRKDRPDCVVDSVDEEVRRLKTSGITYDLLPEPNNPSAAVNVRHQRTSVAASLKEVGVQIEAIQDSTTRTIELAKKFRAMGNLALSYGQRSDIPTEVREESIDASECYRVKAQSLLIQTILNPGPRPVPTVGIN